MRIIKTFIVLPLVIFLASCSVLSENNPGAAGKTGAGSDISNNTNSSNYDMTSGSNETDVIKNKPSLINKNGNTVQERIALPKDYNRVKVEKGSFGEYLRNLPLKPDGSKVKLYDGRTKFADVYEAVIDLDTGDRDLQQCADSVIRLRAEYLYKQELYNDVHFNFTNGFNADYSKWRQGYRVKISGNKTSWVRQTEASNNYSSFRKYLNLVFAYAGTLSLSKEMESVKTEDMQPGDVFIKGATPGHCVIVLDMAENEATGDKLFIIAQGYMPAQDMHILKNPANGDGNPWYTANFGEKLETPEWTFTKDQLMRFK